MSLVLAAGLIGIVAGLRALTAPAIVSWAAALGFLGAVHGWPAFMGYHWTPWVLTVMALGEWVTDQLPATPSRKVPPQVIARLVMGGLSGATLGAAQGGWVMGLIAGAVGAVLGTLGGASARGALARALGNDHPAAFIEDGVALALGVLAIRVML